MAWLDSLLQQYAAGSATPPKTVEQDFDRVAGAVPGNDVADGLAAAFRSDRTPPFPQMLAQLFGRSAGPQRANILNVLSSVLGPALLSQVMGRAAAGRPEITPDVAEQVSPDAVRQAAEEAERKDPSVIDRLSQAYADQPQIVKTLGGVALAIALARLAQKQRRP